MHRTHQPLWTAVTPAWVAALAMLGLAHAAPPAVNQLPTSGRVVAGEASIGQSGALMTIKQSSPRAALDWQTFNVGIDAQVSFLQPSSSSVTLNRVQDSNPSQIFGRITAPGQIFFTNPSGIYFAPSASVDVGGLVASTHSMSNADFMAGTYTFQRRGATGSVTNDGTLNAGLMGFVALLAPEVRNNGVVVAHMGTVALAAGEAYRLHFDGARMADIRVDPASIATLVENKHAILAPGGLIILSAQAANSLQGAVVKSNGTLIATGLVGDGGVIRLEAGNGQTHIAGLVDVSSATGLGGRVSGTGQQVLVGDGATVNATGATGGGTIEIGGAWHGASSLAQATHVYVAPSATLNASATHSGPGGTISVWSDISNPASTTQVYGSLSAEGGAHGGDGGAIETSGHWLDVAGIKVSAASSAGKAGQWLLDPYNVTIADSSAGNTFSTPNFAPSSGDSTVLASSIATALNGGTSVTISTGSSGASLGDITVNSAITKTSGNTDVTLTLQAADSIIVNQAISNTGGAGKLNVKLFADNDNGVHDGVGVIMLNNSISTGGGSVQFGEGTTVSLNAGTAMVGGDVYVGGTSAIQLTTQGGDLSVNGQTLIGNTSGLRIDTTHSTLGPGKVTFAEQLDSGDAYTWVNSAGITWSNALAAAESGASGAVGSTFLATPSNRLQNAIAGAIANYQSAWLGGARGGNGHLGDGAIWYWVSGGLGRANGGVGTAFFNQNGSSGANGSGGSAIGGAYSNWNPGEPNNYFGANLTASGRGEWVMQFTGSQGRWNDLKPTDASGIRGYVKQTNLAASPLTIDAGATGLVTFGGAVGGSKALDSFSVNGSLTTPSGQSLTINANNKVALNGPVSVDGAIHISGGDIAIAASMTATGAHTIALTASGSATQSGGSINASKLLLNGAGDFTLDTTMVGTLAAKGVTKLSLSNAAALTIGAVDSISGVSASGTIAISTTQGDLTVAQDVSTTHSSSDALVLAAGTSNAVGTKTGNVLLAGGTVSVAQGGRAVLYSGSVADSTGVSELVGLGSGNFRYNSKSGTNNFTSVLGIAGTYAVYREQPTLTISADSPSAITYGDTPSKYTTSVFGVNGDTAGQALSTQATVTVGGDVSTSGHLRAALHTLAPSGAVDQLGYAQLYTPGELRVNPLVLTGAAIADVNTTYGSSAATGALTFANRVGADLVSAEVHVSNPSYSTSGNVKAGSYTQSALSGLTGADASNYSFAGFTTDSSNYTVSKLALSGSISSGSSVYGAALVPGSATFTNALTNDQLGAATVVVNTGGLTSTSGNVKAGSYSGIESVIALSGVDAGNYTFAAPTGDYSVSKADLPVTGLRASDKTYDANTSAALTGTANVKPLTGDVLTLEGTATGTFADKNAGSGKAVAVHGNTLTGPDADNYTLRQQSGLSANITPAALVVRGLTAADKTYDGTASVSITHWGELSGLVGSETLVLRHASASVSDASVGQYKTVTALGYTIADGSNGGLASNYQLTQDSAKTTMSIAPAVVIPAAPAAAPKTSVAAKAESEPATTPLASNDPANSTSAPDAAATGAADTAAAQASEPGTQASSQASSPGATQPATEAATPSAETTASSADASAEAKSSDKADGKASNRKSAKRVGSNTKTAAATAAARASLVAGQLAQNAAAKGAGAAAAALASGNATTPNATLRGVQVAPAIRDFGAAIPDVVGTKNPLLAEDRIVPKEAQPDMYGARPDEMTRSFDSMAIGNTAVRTGKSGQSKSVSAYEETLEAVNFLSLIILKIVP